MYRLKRAAHNLGLLLRKAWGLSKPRSLGTGWGGSFLAPLALGLASVITIAAVMKQFSFFMSVATAIGVAIVVLALLSAFRSGTLKTGVFERADKPTVQDERIFDGVQLETSGRILGYWLDGQTMIDANALVHLSDCEPCTQHREMSPIRRGANDMRDEGDIKGFQKVLSKLSTVLTLAIHGAPVEKSPWGNPPEPAGEASTEADSGASHPLIVTSKAISTFLEHGGFASSNGGVSRQGVGLQLLASHATAYRLGRTRKPENSCIRSKPCIGSCEPEIHSAGGRP